MGGTFTCDACKRTFQKGWTEEEAMADMERNHPGGVPEDDRAVVCDDCWEKLRAYWATRTPPS